MKNTLFIVAIFLMAQTHLVYAADCEESFSSLVASKTTKTATKKETETETETEKSSSPDMVKKTVVVEVAEKSSSPIKEAQKLSSYVELLRNFIRMESLDSVRAFIERITDMDIINVYNRKGSNPLLVAVKAERINVVKLLIEKGAEVNNSHEHSGASPLMIAVKKENEELVKVLLEAGADPNYRTFKKRIEYDYEWSAGFFMNQVKRKTRDESTVLHKVVWLGMPNIVRLLLEKGADPNAQDENGYTSLHTSMTKKQEGAQLEITNMLLEAGADVSIRNNEYETPYDTQKAYKVSSFIGKHFLKIVGGGVVFIVGLAYLDISSQ